jgi:tetratricopeptide (TPR) repeat protein
VKALLLVLLGSTAFAQPKPLPGKLAEAAGDAFRKAAEAEAKRDYREAIRQYKRAQEIAPHPNTVFNMAEAYRADKQWDMARRSYVEYLKLAPEAPDRGKVAQLIKDIEVMPGTVEVKSDDVNALIYVDGVMVGPAPRKVEVLSGTHQLDVVTPITYGHMACTVGIGSHTSCNPSGKARVDGNVIISSSWRMGGLNWPVDGQRFQNKGRFVAKPGHYDLKLMDRQCAPLPLDVPKGDDVLTYAYITYPDPAPPHGECVDLKIQQHRVQFP